MRNPTEAARDAGLSARLLGRVLSSDAPATTVMEVCGTHTVAVARMGLRGLLPPHIRLLSGPGCPVCVTPTSVFDEAIFLAGESGAILATYGDALRVPGSQTTLAETKAGGADIRVVYSVTDALHIAQQESAHDVVFFGIGFETTSPTVAWAVKAAAEQGLTNFSVLSAHKALLPAMEALARDEDLAVDAFLCPGHASMVLGAQAYLPLAEKYHVCCAIAGFEANDVLAGLLHLLRQRKRGRAQVDNVYPRAVSPSGNAAALSTLDEVFERSDARWRGLGELPQSGYELTEGYGGFDARRRFLAGRDFPDREPEGCRCGEVLKGKIPPEACGLFGTRCTPETPVGACMVSSEGACGAHHRYREA